MQTLKISIPDGDTKTIEMSLDGTPIKGCSFLFVNNTSSGKPHSALLRIQVPELDGVFDWAGRKIHVVQKQNSRNVTFVDVASGKKIRGISGYTVCVSLIDQITLSPYFCPVLFSQGQYHVEDDEIRPDQLGIDVSGMLSPEEWTAVRGE